MAKAGRGQAHKGGARRTRRAAWLFPLAATLALAACDAPDSGDLRVRNAVIIVIDTLRPDHLSAYRDGVGHSPVIGALADRSLVVHGAFAQSSWTKPSVASIFTSLYTTQHQVLVESTENQLAPGLTTVAEVLQQAGFRTGAVSRNPHVYPDTGFAQGFESFEGFGNWVNGRNTWVAAQTLEWMRSVGPQDRFFLYVHFLDPHDPFLPESGCRSRLVEGLATDDDRVRAGDVVGLIDPQNEDLPTAEIAPEDLAYLIGLYDAEICDVDGAVGQILENLELQGLREQTAVLLTSDHGEGFLEHGRLRHGYDLYDESIRVPLILHVPGTTPHHDYEHLVQHVDIAPTVLELLDVPVPGAFQGQSFAALLQGKPGADVPVVSETMMRGLRKRAVRTDRWKLILDHVAGTTELYDLRDDSAESTNLAEVRPDIVQDLGLALSAVDASEYRVTPEAARGPGNKELGEHLKSLGYLDE